MREIKFRGKSIDTGEWVFGKFLKLATPDEYFILPIGGEASPALFYDSYEETGKYIVEAVKVIPETIGQFTGLKDKNGREIYEGDIDRYGYIVTYVDGSDSSDLGMNVGFYTQRDGFESWAQMEVGEVYEAIGNIHDQEDIANEQI